MSYRDELDAAHARADALSRELATAREKLDQLENQESQALVPVGSNALLARADASSPSARRWLGAPHRIELSRTIEGELPEAAYVELIELIRRRLNNVGATTVLPGSLAWTAHVTHNGVGPLVNLYVTIRGGRTTIRMDEKLTNLAGGIYGGVGGGVGLGVGTAIPVGVGLLSPLLLPVVIPLWLGGTYYACRRLYRRSAKKRAAKLEQLLDDLVELSQRHIDDTTA